MYVAKAYSSRIGTGDEMAEQRWVAALQARRRTCPKALITMIGPQSNELLSKLNQVAVATETEGVRSRTHGIACGI
jgi:hypothetical protein